jgi:HEPN domain-containing protein
MQARDDALRHLVSQWTAKAAQDFEAAVHLLAEGGRFADTIGFLSQQSVEKYLKAFLVFRGIEFPRTHDIHKLLQLVATAHSSLAASLKDADLLTPFGVEVRYPGDTPEMLPGGASSSIELARRVRDAVMASIGPDI